MSKTYRFGCLRFSFSCRPRITWGLALVFQRWEVIALLGPVGVTITGRAA